MELTAVVTVESVPASKKEHIRVEPSQLKKPKTEAVAYEIERLFIDKVVENVGLVITLYDVLDVEGGLVHPGDGGVHFNVKFRLVVFHPFPDEVLVARLKTSTRDGLRLSLGFFDDIIIPEHYLQHPSQFNVEEGVWIWQFEGDSLYMDPEEEVRFQVSEVRFRKPPTALELSHTGNGGGAAEGSADRPFAPMEVIGRINSDGLGCVGWWEQLAAGEEDGPGAAPIDAALQDDGAS